MRNIKLSPKTLTRGFWLLVTVCFIIAALSASYCQADQYEAIQLTSRAQEFLKKNNVEQAIRLLESAIGQDNNYAPAHALLGDIHYQFLRWEKAEKELQKALQLNPKNASYFYKLGMVYFTKAETDQDKALYQKAKEKFAAAAALKYKDPELPYNQGLTEQRLGNYKEASKYFSAAVKLKPKNYKYILSYADICGLVGNFDKANKEYDKILNSKLPEGDPIKVKALNNKYKTISSKNQAKFLKLAKLILPPVVLLAIITAVIIVMLKRKKKGTLQPYAASGGKHMDLKTIARDALAQLSQITGLPFGIIFMIDMEASKLLASSKLGMEKMEIANVTINTQELQNWIEHNQGKPFLFNVEKKDQRFSDTLMELLPMLEAQEIRIGVPFMFQDKLVGLAFLGIKKTPETYILKRVYEKNYNLIHRVGIETARVTLEFLKEKSGVIDETSGAFDRNYFDIQIVKDLKRAEEKQEFCALILIEIDNYERIINAFGQEQWDLVMNSATSILKNRTRAGVDTLARFDVNKLAMILPATDSRGGTTWAEEIRKGIENTSISNYVPQITASLGVAIFPLHATKAEELLKFANEALKESKNMGGNRITCARKKLSDSSDDHATSIPYMPFQKDNVERKKTPEQEAKISSWLSGKDEEGEVSIPSPAAGPNDKNDKFVYHPPWVPSKPGAEAPAAPGASRAKIVRSKLDLGTGAEKAETAAPPPAKEFVVPKPSMPKIEVKLTEVPLSDMEMTQVIPPKPYQPAPKIIKDASKEDLDPLTGYYNWSKFETILKKAFQDARSNFENISVLFFGIDTYAELLSQHGNDQVDAAIKEVTNIISIFFKEEVDIPCRLDADTFVIMLPRTNIQMLKNLAEQILFTVGNAPMEGLPAGITLSLGMVSFPENASSPEELMLKGKENLETAKAMGGNQFYAP